MVNYARMEEVWRSYGPLEPIGPKSKASRDGRRKIAAGVAAVCVAGAAAGLWLRPDVERAPKERPVAERQAPPAPSPGETRDASLAEAAELQAELQLAVNGAPAPMSGAPGALPANSSPALLPSGPPATAQRAPVSPPSARAEREPNRLRSALSRMGLGPRSAPQRRTEPAAAPRRAEPQLATRPAAPVPARPADRADTPLVVASAPTPTRTYMPPVRSAPPPERAPEPAADPAPRLARPTPSFDCGQARGSAERIVCNSPDLAALDRRLQAELAGAIAAGHSRTELMRDQAAWRRRREAAAPDPRAVADSYQQRIQQLRSMQ